MDSDRKPLEGCGDPLHEGGAGVAASPGLRVLSPGTGRNVAKACKHPQSLLSYCQHYTAEGVYDIFAPPSGTVSSVRVWLEATGVAPHRVS